MKNLKYIFLILLFAVPLTAQTEMFYICAGGDGTLPESAICGTAYDAADFNTAGNWDTDDSDDGKIGPNDTVYLMDDGGSFSATFTLQSSGLSGLPITITAQSGDIPIIDGADAISIGLTGVSRDFIVIDGLTVIGWQDAGIDNDGGDFWTVENNTVSGGDNATAARGIHMHGTAFSNISTPIVRSNTINTISTTNNNIANTHSGIRVFCADNTTITLNTVTTTFVSGISSRCEVGSPSTNDIITFNDVSAFYGVGIQEVVVTGTKTISYNLIHNGTGNGYSMNTCAGASDTSLISYNLIHTIAGVAGLPFNGIDLNVNCDGGTVHNNTVYAVAHASFTVETDCGGWTIKNNIFDASTNNEPNAGGGEQAIFITDADLDNGFDNNLLYPKQSGTWSGYVTKVGADCTPITDCARTLATWRTQLGTTWSETEAEANSVDTDPLFVDSSVDNFALQSASPAIDAGENLGSAAALVLDPISIWPSAVVTVEQEAHRQWEIGTYAFILNPSKPLQNKVKKAN